MGGRALAVVTAVILTLGGCAVAGPPGAGTSAAPAPGTTQASATVGASPTAAVTTVTTLPAVKVQSGGSQSVASLQKFADDVAVGRISQLTTQCWTVATERIVQTFTEDGRRAVLKAVSVAPNAGQYGLEWSSGDTFVDVSWTELDSSYACPHVTGGTAPAFPALMDASLLVHRLDARLKGSPVNAKDIAKSYPLLCDSFGDGSGAADAQEAAMTAAQKAALAQLATGKGATFTAQSESAGVLTLGAQTEPAVSVFLEADLCIDRIDA